MTMAEYDFIGDIIGDKPSVKPPCVFSSLKKEFPLGEGKKLNLNLQRKLPPAQEVVELLDDENTPLNEDN